jgi:type IV pilus assembly protein PilN
LIRINLLTEAKAAAARKKAPILPTGAKLNNLLFAAGIAAGVAYIGIMGYARWSTRRQLDEDITKARLEAERLRSIIEEVKGYEEKKKNLEEKINLINQLKTNQKGPVRLMDEISKALPDLVWLTSLDLAGNQITMRGKTLAIPAVATFVENLKRSPFFAEPVFRTMGLDTAGPGGRGGVYSWEMNVIFKPAAALASTGTAAPEPTRVPTPGKK